MQMRPTLCRTVRGHVSNLQMIMKACSARMLNKSVGLCPSVLLFSSLLMENAIYICMPILSSSAQEAMFDSSLVIIVCSAGQLHAVKIITSMVHTVWYFCVCSVFCLSVCEGCWISAISLEGCSAYVGVEALFIRCVYMDPNITLIIRMKAQSECKGTHVATSIRGDWLNPA